MCSHCLAGVVRLLYQLTSGDENHFAREIRNVYVWLEAVRVVLEKSKHGFDAASDWSRVVRKREGSVRIGLGFAGTG